MSAAMVSPLLEPVALGRLSLRNRIAMAPMTREMSPGGVPTQAVRDYYAARAMGGVGLIITEGAATDSYGAFGASVPRLYGADALAGWRAVVDAVHAEGAAIVPQLWHVGAFEPSMVGMRDSRAKDSPRISPSGLAAPGMAIGRAMAQGDIEAAIAGFAAAAANAQACGFDGIELHGAHGYLFDQFFWAGTNRRDDAYGVTERTRFAVEALRAIRARVGPDFPIILRLSQWKQLDYGARIAETPHELAALLGPLVEAGVDAFHCSTRRFWEAAFADDPRTLGGWVKALGGKPVIIVGSVTLANDFKSPDGKTLAEVDIASIARLEELLARDQFDLVAIGRALLANPDWPRLLAEGRLDVMRGFTRDMLERL